MSAALTVERLKLFSLRSTWICLGCTVLAVLAPTALAAAQSSSSEVSVADSQDWTALGLMIMLVLGVLVATSDYRFGTINTTFEAFPGRRGVLLAKAAVAGGVGTALGLVTALGAWAVTVGLHPGGSLALDSAERCRQVAGYGLVYGLGAVLAVSVGMIIRHTAGAVTVMLLWPQLFENLVAVVPGVGERVGPWLPFKNLLAFVGRADTGHSPGQSLGVFVAVVAVVLAGALLLGRRGAAG